MATIRKTLTANVSVTNTDNQAGYVNLAVTVPVSQDAQQKLVDIVGEEGWTLKYHANGDAYLSRKQYLNAGETFKDKIDFRLDVNNYSLDFTQKTPGESISSSERSQYTSPEKLVESTNASIVKIANQIKAQHPGDVWAQAKEAFDYPIDKFSYKTMSQNKGAAWAVANNTGDCTEYAATTAALLKAMGIPAKLVNVFWGGTDGELQGSGFTNHHRLKAFLPDKDGSGSHWYILDPNLGANPESFEYGFGLGSTDSVDYNHGTWSYSAVAARSGVGDFSTDISYSLINSGSGTWTTPSSAPAPATGSSTLRPETTRTFTGTDGADRFIGTSANELIVTKGGNDKIWGGGGSDVITTGSGRDAITFDTKIGVSKDVIVDFDPAYDLIRLNDSIFSKLTEGKLSSSWFRAGTKALDANDYIVYDQGTGKLFYDADGSGSGAAIHFATLENKAALTAADFLVI
jgi:transglutaminase-like putative cysteine protease